MEENFGKLGIQDFFNVLVTGGFFFICASWIAPWLWEQYTNMNKEYEYESYVGIIVLFFVIGIVLQEVGSLWDEKFGHIKQNVLNSFLLKNVKIKKGIIRKTRNNIRKVISSIFKLKNEKKDNFIIDNGIKLRIYRKYGKDILKEKDCEFNNEFTENQCKFIYAYCLYYVENQGKSGKYEKMRGLFDMSRTLTASCILLTFESIIMMIYYVFCCNCVEKAVVSGGQALLFILGAIIFFNRAERLMNYRARMLMEVYDVCMDVKKGN